MSSLPPTRSGRIGVFGGVFDPVHRGHLCVAESALTDLELDSILFVPAGQPPHKQQASASATHRRRMLEIAIANRPDFAISDIEIDRAETSFSVHTLNALIDLFPGSELYFIMGLDAFLDLETWYRPGEVLRLARLVVVFRPPWNPHQVLASPFIQPDSLTAGLDTTPGGPSLMETKSVEDTPIYFLKGPEMEISSSLVRGRIAAGKDLSGLLPEGVESYILSNKLYQFQRGG